jgi:hypothetical protein
MVRGLLFIVAAVTATAQVGAQDGLVSRKQNPKVDHNLSPYYNQRINPNFNTTINPTFNWNYNPVQNKTINPDSTTGINPLHNPNLNPKQIEIYNPMLNNLLHPKNYSWKGRYLFDSTDNLIGFITVASQQILLCFNKDWQWTCYFVLTAKGTYNQFQLTGEWTGRFLAPDSLEGLNLFTKEGLWTGHHVK